MNNVPGFGDLFGDAFKVPRQPPPDKVEKGVPWNARTFDGVIYVRLSDVAELLKVNSVLPKVRAGIERRLDG